MNKESRKNIPSELENQSNELNDEQLEKISGGEMSLDEIPGIRPVPYRRCAVNSQHCWPNGCDACPECGSTEYISTVLPG